MSAVWSPETYDTERRRLVPCFDEFYGTVAELVIRFCPNSPRILDLGAGTGILSGVIAQRVPTAQFHLLDASSEMLKEASKRLTGRQFTMFVQSLDSDLPAGQFHAIVSALAIHHLTDAGKRSLYSRILASLTPSGIFINAEQVSG